MSDNTVVLRGIIDLQNELRDVARKLEIDLMLKTLEAGLLCVPEGYRYFDVDLVGRWYWDERYGQLVQRTARGLRARRFPTVRDAAVYLYLRLTPMKMCG